MSAPGSSFALVDCDQFYVSCERLFNPRLCGKPVVVLSNNDGCAISRSPEAKALGVQMAAPWFLMQDLAKKHGIIALSSNYQLYASMSNKCMAVLREYSPRVETYSIDESFLLLDGLSQLWPDMTTMGHDIRHKVQTWVGLPVGVGIGSTKTLAKLANHLAKKRPVYNGVCDLQSMQPDEAEQIYASLPAGEVWGVGHRISEQLARMRIHTVRDLRNASQASLRQQFGVRMERPLAELHGVSCIPLEDVAPARKQIVSSRAYGERVTTLREIEESVTMYAARATERLRRQRSTCAAVHVFVETDRFLNDEPQYNNGRTVPLPEPTDDLRVITKAAMWGLKKVFRLGIKYKKAGVMLMELAEGGRHQGTLFDSGVSEMSSAPLMQALDAINQRFGKDTLRLASGLGQHRWTARFDMVSQRYTTNWNELPLAR